MFSERVITMSQSKIKLNATEEVQEFVNAASRCDFDIDVYYNRFLIDAKSILGVLSLDLTRELTVDCQRILGKMAHSERRGESVAINIYGEQDMKIFESGVKYFK